MDYSKEENLFSALEEPSGTTDLRRLENLQVYQIALKLAQGVWDQASKMDIFSRDTIGKQWVRSADSIAANIAEGYGRYSFKENLRFCYYARGSLFETRTWLLKATSRNLIQAAEQENLEKLLTHTRFADFFPEKRNLFH